jgi:hypothetical protein
VLIRALILSFVLARRHVCSLMPIIFLRFANAHVFDSLDSINLPHDLFVLWLQYTSASGAHAAAWLAGYRNDSLESPRNAGGNYGEPSLTDSNSQVAAANPASKIGPR